MRNRDLSHQETDDENPVHFNIDFFLNFDLLGGAMGYWAFTLRW